MGDAEPYLILEGLAGGHLIGSHGLNGLLPVRAHLPANADSRQAISLADMDRLARIGLPISFKILVQDG